MKYPSPINFIPGNAFRRASLFRRFSLWLAALSIILPALALLPAAAPVQAQEGSMVVLPDFVAQVRSLKFYPTDYGFKSFYERKYSAQFPGSSSKHINWELVLDHPFKRPGRVNFTINAVLYGPDGRKLAESANEAWIEADMNTSQHTETWGADKPGYWKPGTYRVAIQIGGKQVATGSFQIDGAGPPPPGPPPPGPTPPGPTPPGPPPPGPSTGEVAAFTNLNSTVVGIKFFPGPTTGIPYGQRQYSDKFDAKSSTFIFWEVTLEYPPGARPNVVEFPITAIWYDPAGKILTTQKSTAKVQPDWDSSVHSHGFGSSKPGIWPAGTYQVILKVGDQTLISGNFQVTGAGKEEDFLSRHGAKVKSLRFFESGQGIPPAEERNYMEKFAADQTRYINWELSLDLAQGKRTQRENFTLSATWYSPDGKVLTTQSRNAYIEPDWPDSWHVSGYGAATPGMFKPGIYRVVVKINNKEVAQGAFEVTGRTAPQRDLLSRLNGRVEGVKFYEGKDGHIPVDQRQYGESFPGASARFMYVDLLLEFGGTRTEEVNFAMEGLWYAPDGRLFATTKKTGRIAPDWEGSVHAMGYGRDNPGLWKPGTYRVVIKIDGQEVGSGTFQIY